MEYIILLLNNVFAFFDRIIAWAIAEVYNLIIIVSSAKILDSAVIEQFSSRVGILLSLFMLFWLAFRMIKYAINPDLTTDEGQGFGKITVNVVVMLTMLVLVNYAFTFAMTFQQTIIKSNVLMKAVFGVTDQTTNPIDDGEQVGNEMAYYLYAAFISPSDMLTKCKGFYGMNAAEAGECAKQIEDRASYTVRSDWVTGNNDKEVKYLLSSSVVSARDGSDYLFTYIPVISTICGVIMLVLVISIAVDVAVRVIEMAFLQIIAPVPIISYIDPKNGKDGMFKNWLTTVIKTYANLFIKLFTLYFAVFFISYAAKGEIILDGNKKATIQSQPFVVVLIIIGVLMFAKKLPGLLSDIFGIKLDGGTFKGTAKAMKRTLGFGVGAIGGGIAGAIGGAQAGVGARGVLGGALSGTWAGAKAGANLKHRDTALGRGMHTAYKHVTGNDMKHFNAMQAIGTGGAKDRIADLSADKSRLQQSLNYAQSDTRAAEKNYQNAYSNYLKHKDSTDESVRKRYASELENARSNYDGALKAEKEISKAIGVIDDQISDYTKRYSIDHSPTSAVKDARSKADKYEGYGTAQYGQKSSDNSSNTSSSNKTTSSTNSNAKTGGNSTTTTTKK